MAGDDQNRPPPWRWAVGDERITPPDAAELANCFATHAREVFGYACALARGDRTRAGDLVQAAFEAAAQTWPLLRNLAEDQRRGWLRLAVATVAVSGLRREGATSGRPARLEVPDQTSPTQASEPRFAPVTLERGGQVIRELPERQHAIAVMRWQLNMKEAEIAAALALTEQTVASALHRVSQQLAALLEPGPGAGQDEQQGAPS
jgi:RNA polymerase sigma factor (sigma-70 family)